MQPLAETIDAGPDIRLEMLAISQAQLLLDATRSCSVDLARCIPGFVALEDRGQAERHISAKRLRAEVGRGAEWGIWQHETLLGCAGLHSIDWEVGHADLGLWLTPGARGRGVATTVGRALVRQSFTELDLHRVSARCIPENVHARALNERLGMVEEARLRDVWKFEDRYADQLVFRLLFDEWRAG